MVSAKPKPELLVIVGETASGKSALALQVAKELNGEIIAADSRTIYKGMDIGTAKPDAKARGSVSHWGIDLIGPDETYSAAQFKRYAKQKIKDIKNRGKLSVLVGGSGLYIDSILFDYRFSPSGAKRDSQNPRHLEKTGQTAKDKKIRSDAVVVGLQIPREELKRRIAQRVEDMINAGFIEEVRAIADKYGWESHALKAPGYQAFRGYLEGQVSLEEAKARFIKNDLGLAKRQRTWFKRNPDIQWFSSADEACRYIASALNN